MKSTWAHRVLGLTAGIVVLSVAGVARADEPGTAALQSDIELLKNRLARLESRLASQQAVSSGASVGSGVVSVPSGTGIEISGFVDTAYTYNFLEPEDMANDGRIFDVNANSFVVNNAQLNIGKGVDDYSPLGFNLALMFGDDAEVTHSTGFFGGAGSDQSLDIQQAYVEWFAPWGDGVNLTFGKQATLIGAEVIESMNNWNYSRSYLFGLAIPFTHTGIRASMPLSETMTFTTGVNNGWSIANDNNLSKGIEGQLAWEDGPFFVSFTGMYSPEVSGTTSGGITVNDNAKRWITDIVATYQVNDDLALMFNYDYGHDEDALSTDADTAWQGFAAYAKYNMSDDWSLAGRYEFFRDNNGVKAGSSFSGAVGDLSLQELTFTSEHKISTNLIARLEYRHDIANSAIFGHDDSGLQNYQDTVAVEFILPF